MEQKELKQLIEQILMRKLEEQLEDRQPILPQGNTIINYNQPNDIHLLLYLYLLDHSNTHHTEPDSDLEALFQTVDRLQQKGDQLIQTVVDYMQQDR